MAVAKKDSKKPTGKNLIAGVIAQIEALFGEHIGEVLQFVDEAENKKQTVNFAVAIDCSESEPQVEVVIRYSQSVTDKRSIVLDDPNQGSFHEITEGADAETAKRRETNVTIVKGDFKAKGKDGKKGAKKTDGAEAGATENN